MVEIDPEIEETVYCDLNCVSRNLMNLVANAAKHTAQGSITVHMTLELMRTQIVVAVKDTGVGILDEMKDVDGEGTKAEALRSMWPTPEDWRAL